MKEQHGFSKELETSTTVYVI